MDITFHLVVWVIAVGFAIGRFFVPTHDVSIALVYQDLAHIFVGFLFGWWLMSHTGESNDSTTIKEKICDFFEFRDAFPLVLLSLLTIIEIGCFLAFKFF